MEINDVRLQAIAAPLPPSNKYEVLDGPNGQKWKVEALDARGNVMLLNDPQDRAMLKACAMNKLLDPRPALSPKEARAALLEKNAKLAKEMKAPGVNPQGMQKIFQEFQANRKQIAQLEQQILHPQKGGAAAAQPRGGGAAAAQPQKAAAGAEPFDEEAFAKGIEELPPAPTRDLKGAPVNPLAQFKIGQLETKLEQIKTKAAAFLKAGDRENAGKQISMGETIKNEITTRKQQLQETNPAYKQLLSKYEKLETEFNVTQDIRRRSNDPDEMARAVGHAKNLMKQMESIRLELKKF